jgi:hypothetical protein
VRNHHRRLSWAAHTATATTRRDIHLQPPFRPKPPGHMTACARPSIHLHYHCAPIPSRTHCCTAVATRRSGCCPRSQPLSCAQPRPVAGFPLLKPTHPDAGLHTPCYSCPTHTHPLALAAPHVATLGSRALQIQSPFRQTCLLRLRNTAPTTPSVPVSCEFPRHHHLIPVRATSPSSAATCASLCVALLRNAHLFTRAIDQSCHCDLTTI